MRGSVVIEKILEALQRGAENGAALLDAASSGYYGTQKKLQHAASGGGAKFGKNLAAAFHNRQKFYGLMAHLKKQGFVDAKKENKKSFWKITKRGSEKLEILRERNRFSKASANYPESKPESSLKIVAYDIPSDGSQKKRDWLRWALRNINFKMLQKSVWVGKNKIPEEFLDDLRSRQLLPHVQIFEVTKSGTLKEIA